jgi:hypothetical protein
LGEFRGGGPSRDQESRKYMSFVSFLTQVLFFTSAHIIIAKYGMLPGIFANIQM